MNKLYRNRNWLYQKYWNEKLPIKAIRSICNCSYSTLYRWLEKFKIDDRRHHRPTSFIYKDREWLIKKYRIEGLFAYEIAKICNMNKTTIEKWIRKYGIKKDLPLYKKKMWLIQKYIKEKLSTYDIAKICNVTPSAICFQMIKFNIKRRKMNEINIGEKNYMWGRTHSKEARELISKTHKGKKISEIHKKINSKKMKQWHKKNRHPLLGKKFTEEEFTKVFRALRKRPTAPEKMFDEMTPDIIRYIGNRAWWRRLDDGHYHNPDFKVTGQNKVIEVFGDYWHRNDNPQDLINLYNQSNLDCLVIWEHEIYKQPDEVLNKVINFI